MRWTRPTLLVAVAACAFRHGTSAGMSDSTDIDTPSNATCHLAEAGSESLAGKVGLSPGGGVFKTVRCATGGLLVGMALDMSNQPVNGGDTKSAHGFRIACADVVEDGSGGHTGTPTTADIEGFGSAGFTPSTMTPVAPCPAGSVVTGMHVYGSHYMTLFLTAHLVCTRYDQNGGAGSSFPIDITGTGSDTMYPSGADCPTGQQVVKIIADTGAGLDSIQLYCAPTVCS